MNSASQDTAEHLASKGIGTIGGQTKFAIYINDEPPKPANVITLYDRPSPAPARAMNTVILVRFTNIQIRARSIDQKEGYQKLDDILTEINSIESWITINDTVYQNFQPTTDIIRMARDEDKRWIFVVNYQITRK